MSSLQDFSGTVHVVFSSHWDREWYLPFQKFRGKLVVMMDRVLDEMEAGRLAFYQMDGQFVPVEDYLQIRPEREPLLRRLIGEGRFKVGPWYDIPDEFLVSGESLIRNFQLGMSRAEAFGQTSKVGWLCDLFGHSSQIPQLLRLLGIDNALLWRGVDFKSGNPVHWEGPDGSRVLAHRFPENGYADFGMDVRKIARPDEKPTLEEMVHSTLTYFEKLVAGSEAKTLLVFDGADHIEFDAKILEVIAQLNAQAGREVFKVSSLDGFMEELREHAVTAEPIRGELREPAAMETFGWLIPGVGSSRIPLKQANHAGETLLTLWAEPWCSAACSALGTAYPARALELAWEYLIKNHPHDSICGCSTDETHAAMPYRFEQSRQLAEYHLETALNALAACAVQGRVKEGEIALSLFAPVAGATHRVPELFVKLPKDWPQFSEFFGFEKKPSMRAFDLEGREIACQLLQVIPSITQMRVPEFHFPAGENRQGVRLALDTILPTGASQHFVLRRCEGPTRLPKGGEIGVGRATLRNEFLEVTAAQDGTLCLTDLQSGKKYGGLLAMEDTADIGDGWFHGIALQDRAYLSTGGKVSVGLGENGPLLARLHVRVEWEVPAEFDFQSNQRSARLVPLVVEHRITLRKGDAQVEIETTVHNHVRDHRVRILCPTGFTDTEVFWSDTPFDAIERPIRLRDTHAYREIQVEMTPQQNWVATGDGSHGLALLAPGQYESAVLDQPDRPLCVTLLRAFRRAVLTDGNEGGQIQGNHTFRLALRPFAFDGNGGLPASELFGLAQRIAAPVRSVALETRDLGHGASSSASLAQPPRVEGDVVLTACHLTPQNAWSLRVFNPQGEAVSIRLPEGWVWSTSDLRGQNVQPIAAGELRVGPKQIVTFCAARR